MNVPTMLLGGFLCAIAAAILYIIGLKKAIVQHEDLERRLMHVCGSRVMKYLKKHKQISEQEIEQQIQDVSVGPFWSHQRIQVQNASKAKNRVIQFLLEQQYIEEDKTGLYRLKK